MIPYKGRRGRSPLPEVQVRREHRQNNIAQALQQPAGQLIGVLASLAPGPAGIVLRAVLNVFDGLKERERLEEDREFKASIVSLRKAVDALLAMQEEQDEEVKPADPSAPDPVKAQPIPIPETPKTPKTDTPAPESAPENPLDAILKRLKPDAPKP